MTDQFAYGLRFPSGYVLKVDNRQIAEATEQAVEEAEAVQAPLRWEPLIQQPVSYPDREPPSDGGAA